MLDVLRKFFFWTYARNTWQWDLLCVVILIFIFGSPKSWWENSELAGRRAHQSPTAATVLVGAELIDNAEDKGKIERVVRDLTGRPAAEVVNVRKVAGKDGKARGYEVDIR